MKSKLINCILATAIGAIAMIMMHSCAQQMSSISGGDKDTIPPAIIKSTPGIMTGEFDGKMVKIRFNEYFTLENVEQTFMMTPPHDSIKPKIKAKGKWLTVKFKEPLRPDTTYTLQFFNSVKDFNEGNILKGFQFTFSTGPEVDSLAVSGQVVDAETLEKEPDMLVMLYGSRHNAGDSVFMKYKPDYITRTDTAGSFKLSGLRPGVYRIYALKDINESQKFDLENEKIAFLKTEVIPLAKRLHTEDSLTAGTILHKGPKGHRYLDTLLRDTVIVRDILWTTPNNITLYTFEEKHLVQYIAGRSRDIRQRIKLVFNKPVDHDTVLITHVDDTLKSPAMVYDFNYFRDSLSIWLKDSADIFNDTLQIRVTFSTLDSLKNPTLETDTINVKYARKKLAATKDNKSKAEPPREIDSLNFKIKSNFAGDFDIEKSIKLDVPIMYSYIDTSLINIYECIDTTFCDDLNQKLLKNQRLDSAHYRLIFKRPIKGDIVWYPTDSIVSPQWYRATYSAGRDTVEMEVLDSAMIRKSKFSNMLKYRNDYYMGQEQKIRDSVNTVIIDQKLVKYERVSRDSIKLVLEKAPTRGLTVEPLNLDKLPENSIEIQQNGYNITILLKDSTAIKKDTLVMKLTTYDRKIHNKAHKVIERTYKDTLDAVYRIKYQKLINTQLAGSDTMIFVFSRPLTQMPEVSLCKYPSKGVSWYTPTLSSKADTMYVVSADADFIAMDTIRYAISYPNIDRNEMPILQTDTLMTVRPSEVQEKQRTTSRRKSGIGKESQKQQEEARKNQTKASLKIPVEYTMANDTMNAKNKILTFETVPGRQYMFEVDDSAFVSIYGTPNLYMSSKAKIRETDYYGELTINISNIGHLENFQDIDENIFPFELIDTSRTLRRRINPKDTMPAEHPSLREGQALVCLCGPKGEVKYQQSIKTDSIVKFSYIVPGEYIIKIIHDRNMNGKWDTGKYLEQHYPERTTQFPKKQTVKSKWNTEAVWRL